MGVMSDLSGNASGVEKPDIADRKFLEFDMDNFDKRMAAIEPGVAMRVENKLGEEGGEKLVGQSDASRRWTISARRPSPGRSRRSPSCWRRASSSPTCCATWTARSAAERPAQGAARRPATDGGAEATALAEQGAVRQTKRSSRRSDDMASTAHGNGRQASRGAAPSDARCGRIRVAPASRASSRAASAPRPRSRTRSAPWSSRRSPTRAHQGRRARHDRGDDRPARREAVGADQRDPPRAGVPADRERLARPALSRLQLRDRRHAQDPGDERLQDELYRNLQALSRRALGPEPAVQEDLRGRVRPARRRALWRLVGDYHFEPFADRRAAAARPRQDRRRGPLRRSSPAPPRR